MSLHSVHFHINDNLFVFKLIDSDSAVANRLAISRLDNCEWIGFFYNSFKLFYFYCFILYIFGLSYRGVNPKGTYYDIVNIIYFKNLWIGLNEK